MSEDDVNIRIKRNTWRRLHNRKEPNDSFDDVIRRVLDQVEEDEEGNLKTAATTTDWPDFFTFARSHLRPGPGPPDTRRCPRACPTCLPRPTGECGP
jgi:hypothetical protein